MLRRLIVIICGVVALDFFLSGMCSYWFGWKFELAEIGLTMLVGLAAIGYYEWRFAKSVARYLDSDMGRLDGQPLEKILLLIAGFALLLPGVVTDFVGLLLLVPAIRRMVANSLQAAASPQEAL